MLWHAFDHRLENPLGIGHRGAGAPFSPMDTVSLLIHDNPDGSGKGHGEHLHCPALLVQLRQQNSLEERERMSQQEFSSGLA